jgi:hypothetical protein
MNYAWAALSTFIVLIVVAFGVIGAHRWASSKKTKITLDVIAALVTGVVALATQTFTGVLQVFPSETTSASNNGQHAALCPIQDSGALLQLWPNDAKRGSHMTIAGDGFPANSVVEISFYGAGLPSSGKPEDIGAMRSDECGKFNYSWSIPGSLAASSSTGIEISAFAQDPRSGNKGYCCRATAMLTMNAA